MVDCNRVVVYEGLAMPVVVSIADAIRRHRLGTEAVETRKMGGTVKIVNARLYGERVES